MKKIYVALLLLLAGAATFTSCIEEDDNPAEGTPNPFASIAVVRDLYRGNDLKLEPKSMMGAYRIGAVVVSDADGKNFADGQLFVQNTSRGFTRGIVLALGEAAAATYNVGDSLVIDVTGSTLTKVNGAMTIKGLNPSGIVKVADGVKVTPKTVALGELVANFQKYEGTLVEVTADISPVPASDETYSGDKVLDDGSGNTILLHTQASATFSGAKLPASATFIGIPTLEGEAKQLRMRTITDAVNPSGPIYTGFPEDFETPDASQKGSYNMANNNIDLKTGNWLLYQAILGTTPGRDRFNAPGAQCIRMQQNLSTSAYVQMNFDLPNGASKVTLWYGTYYTDASSSWQLEYSTDAGETWTKVGETITDASQTPKAATFLMDIKGPVRFRVNKLGLGPTSVPNVYNGRLSIEDIAIYQN